MVRNGCALLLILGGMWIAGLGAYGSRFEHSSSAPEFACPVDKIQFTQDTGCVNDGSVEFCIPVDDPEAKAAVEAITPNVSYMPSRGRAGCILESQLLTLIEVRRWCNPDQPEAMTDAGWEIICQLAALPFVEEIVPTWYE